MIRLLFEKTGNAVWMSHLDLMRLFQRAFQRAGLPLTHTQGFNPRPSVSIALPMSLGMESVCELLDFSLDGEPVPSKQIQERLNGALVPGVRILDVYEGGSKLKNLAWLECCLTLEYDGGVLEDAAGKLEALFSGPGLLVEKKGKTGVSEQDIIPLLSRLEVGRDDEHTLVIRVRVHCQNPALNPMQLLTAINRYLPELAPSFSRCRRIEVFDENGNIFR